MSSRNLYLSKAERAVAGALPRALDEAAARLRAGEPHGRVLADGLAALRAAGFAPDYLDLRRADDLSALNSEAGAADLGSARLFVAARIGGTRLIDNVSVRDGLTYP